VGRAVILLCVPFEVRTCDELRNHQQLCSHLPTSNSRLTHTHIDHQATVCLWFRLPWREDPCAGNMAAPGIAGVPHIGRFSISVQTNRPNEGQFPGACTMRRLFSGPVLLLLLHLIPDHAPLPSPPAPPPPEWTGGGFFSGWHPSRRLFPLKKVARFTNLEATLTTYRIFTRVRGFSLSLSNIIVANYGWPVCTQARGNCVETVSNTHCLPFLTQ
jgi:hypothetical protein